MSDCSTTFLLLKSGRKINYASESAVRQRIQDRGFSDVDTAVGASNSDLKSGVYEGGLKIWEGAVDLCNYIDSNSEICLKGKRFLELGCGAGLPTILALQKGASFAAVNDFNDFVLECFCQTNFRLNDIPDESWCSIAGSWSNLIRKVDQPDPLQPKSFDVILTAETIYNPQYYEDLHATFDHFLAENGQILLAAKVYYFGLNTSIIDFQEFVTTKGVFKCADMWISSEEGIPRKIVQLTRLIK